MTMTRVGLLLLASLLINFTACAQAQSLQPRGERLLSIEATEAADNDYDRSFALAQEAGMQVTSLSLAWDELETSTERYGMTPNFLEIANAFYPSQGVAISLTLAPIDTNNLRLPEDLKEKSFADPELIERFKRLLDYVFLQIPNLELSCLVIGNEIDAYLLDNEQRWQEYQIFFREVSSYAKSLRPNLVVGTKVTFSGLELAADFIRDLNAYTDVVMLTYYPLDADFTVRNPDEVATDFDEIVEAFPNKPIFILEAGYPSSSLLNSSEEKQAEFIRAVFNAWDKHVAQIKLVSFTWLHDVSPDELEFFASYYQTDDEKFLAFIASLGLRTFVGEAKQAYDVLKEETEARGW
jgi:hypothetical protein